MDNSLKQIGSNNGKADPLLAALQLPAGDVLIRKIGGPDGTHAWLGYVKRGRVYCCAAARAAEFCAGGEFEALDAYKDAVEAGARKDSRASGPAAG